MAIHRTDIKEWVLEAARRLGSDATQASVLAEIEREHGHALQISRYKNIWHQTAISCAEELRREGRLKPGAERWEAA
jgi:hypothetical protein